jgi:hypothetical protein
VNTKCNACKSGAVLTPAGPEGECLCVAGKYDDGTGNCQDCHNDCATCTAGSEIKCQTCENAGNLQPDTYTCIGPCPTGYTASAAACTGTAGNVAYVFDKLTKQWTSGTVIFNAGLDATVEATIEPFTYKLRGLWFDGTNHVLTLDPSSGLYLHSNFSFLSWIHSKAATGSIFSKSFNVYSSTTTSDFLDLRMASGGNVELVIKQYNTSTSKTSLIATGIQNAWTSVAFTVSYAKATCTTSVIPIVNTTAGTVITHTDFTVLEKLLTDGAIGARRDGSGTGMTSTNKFHGYIYSINIQM